jgi:hypothetical protein
MNEFRETPAADDSENESTEDRADRLQYQARLNVAYHGLEGMHAGLEEAARIAEVPTTRKELFTSVSPIFTGLETVCISTPYLLPESDSSRVSENETQLVLPLATRASEKARHQFHVSEVTPPQVYVFNNEVDNQCVMLPLEGEVLRIQYVRDYDKGSTLLIYRLGIGESFNESDTDPILDSTLGVNFYRYHDNVGNNVQAFTDEGGIFTAAEMEAEHQQLVDILTRAYYGLRHALQELS